MDKDTEAITGIPVRLATRPRVTAASNLTDVALEQMQYLADHVGEAFCVNGCPECDLMLEVRALLLDRFRVTEHGLKRVK